MAGQIAYTQERVEGLLAANPFFDDLTILSFDKGDIQNTIDQALMAIKAGVLIMTPSKRNTIGDLPEPYSEIDVVCEVIDNVTLNDTGKHAAEIVENVEAALHNQPQPDAAPFVHKGSVLTGIGKNDRNDTVVTWACDFTTYGGVSLDITRAATPVIVDDGSGNITITCATAGTNIRYTVDGKNPGTSATLYAGSFSIGSGVTVKARAWNWGFTVSQQGIYTRA